MAHAGLAYLATADMASLPAAAQAECLRGLERAESLHTAARAGVLAAFMSCGGCEDDGQGSARAWLRWQTRITSGAAAGAVGWARRLAAHPAVGEALAAGEISASWAREICSWTARLPEGNQADADAILLAAAAGGAELADLAGLAEEMRRRCAAARRRRWWRVRGSVAAAGPDAAWRGPGGRGPESAVHRRAGRGAGRVQQESRPGRHPDYGPAPPRRAGGGLPAADRLGVRAGPGRAADADPVAHDPGSAARPGRRRRRGGGVGAGGVGRPRPGRGAGQRL